MARRTHLVQSSGEKLSPVTRRQVDPWVMRTALEAAGGETRRLHFHDDGSVVTLNYVGQECPECFRLQREAKPKRKSK